MSETRPPLEFICDRVAEITRVDRDRVQPTSRFIDFGLNSVRALDLVVELETAYEISIADRDLADLHTLQDVADYVERHLQHG